MHLEIAAEDRTVVERVRKLVDKEHRLQIEHGPEGADTSRLDAIQARLDQCWYLLHQRRARREFGGEPDESRFCGAQPVERFDPEAPPMRDER